MVRLNVLRWLKGTLKSIVYMFNVNAACFEVASSTILYQSRKNITSFLQDTLKGFLRSISNTFERISERFKYAQRLFYVACMIR